MRTTRTVAGVVLAGALLALTACGSDGDSGSGSGTDGGGSGGDLCEYAQDLEASLGDDAFANLDEATFDRIESIVGNVQDRAPDEIKADVDQVAENIAEVREIFAEYDYDLAALGAAATEDAELTARLENLSGPEFEAASDRVSAYLEEECGIESGS